MALQIILDTRVEQVLVAKPAAPIPKYQRTKAEDDEWLQSTRDAWARSADGTGSTVDELYPLDIWQSGKGYRTYIYKSSPHQHVRRQPWISY